MSMMMIDDYVHDEDDDDEDEDEIRNSDWKTATFDISISGL